MLRCKLSTDGASKPRYFSQGWSMTAQAGGKSVLKTVLHVDRRGRHCRHTHTHATGVRECLAHSLFAFHCVLGWNCKSFDGGGFKGSEVKNCQASLPFSGPRDETELWIGPSPGRVSTLTISGPRCAAQRTGQDRTDTQHSTAGASCFEPTMLE